MDSFSDSPSLLGLLHPQGSELLLKIRRIEDHPPGSRPNPNPFHTLSPDKAFTRIVAAQFLTRAESSLRELFILQQSDDYPASVAAIDPLTNTEIEKRWQNAARAYRAPEASRRIQKAPILLSNQFHPSGRLAAFQGLLFCRFKEVYFHPVCPFCGGLLQLCTDDDLLRSHGLAPYGTSLRRHLHCLQCLPHQSGTIFYVLSRSAAQPENVRDFGELRDNFSNLIVRTLDTPPDFPCSRCEEQGNCFGPLGLARTRIVPFSFYPFFAFLFEADTLHAADFLMLLSGASWESLIENARTHSCEGRVQHLLSARHELQGKAITLFPAPSERRFLELLYLKLSFLEQLVNSSSDLQPDPMQGNGFRLDHVWVRLPEQPGDLPGLWNFSVHPIGLGLDLEGEEELPPLAPAQWLYHCAILWFFTLLVNSRQDMRTVRSALARKRAARTPRPSEGSAGQQGGDDTVFAPENLEWEAARAIPLSLHPLWEKALSLGFDLLSAAFAPEAARPLDATRTGLNNLKDKIFSALFTSPIPSAPAENENLRMAAILSSIAADWNRPRPSAPEETPTVILRPADPSLTETPASHPSVPAAESAGILPETIHLRASSPLSPPTPGFGKTAPSASLTEGPAQTESGPSPGRKSERWGGDLVLETVVLRSEPAPPGAGSPAEAPPGMRMESDMPETVILGRGHPARRQPETVRPAAPASGHPKGPFAGNSAPASGPSSAGRSLPDRPEDADRLAETIILRPGKKEK